MSEIKCPKCGEVFQVDAADYAEIVSQVRNEQFEKELTERTNSLRREMKASMEVELNRANEMHRMEIFEKDQALLQLQAKVDSAELVKKMTVKEAVQEKDLQIERLNSRINQVKQEAKLREASMEKSHQEEVSHLRDALAQSRDFKQRLSTKMLGESLEQHCLTVFNRVRADAFPNAYFEKDNEIIEGTKGDFIFRENTDDGIEIISILFEMKNEAESTVKKHRNEDFLEKLDKDRRKKNCEYAVLVSTLEADSEYYNDGIVTAYQYEKMFIIRPQFFVPLISLLRKAALNHIETRRQLMMIQRENMDVQKFDHALIEFRTQFGKNCESAQNHFEKTIKEIDNAIKHLEKVREELEGTKKQLGLANDKAQGLTIKKLTRGNIGMQQKFLDAGIEIR